MDINTPILFDSSLTALSESEYIQQDETIKVNFIEHLMKCNGQIILAEQKEKMPEGILALCGDAEIYDAQNFRITQFSHDLDHGRVGFFPGVLDF